MDVHTIILMLTLTLASLSVGVCLGVLAENRRSRQESNYHAFIETELYNLWLYVEDASEKNHQQTERIRQEISYTQKYLLMGDSGEDIIKISRGSSNTLVFPEVTEEDQVDDDYEDNDTLH